jgi:hypothetical protein
LKNENTLPVELAGCFSVSEGIQTRGVLRENRHRVERLKLGYPPGRIDILTTLHGVEFSECYAARTVVDVDGISVNFIDLENLKRNRKARGRHQDLGDLENLE